MILSLSNNVSRSTLPCATYLPFYGGAKGQYLEVTKSEDGTVIKERIVSENDIVCRNIVKNNDENLLSKVLAANLQSLQSQSISLIKIHTKARATGELVTREKAQFKSQLGAIVETASNLIKLIEEIGDDVSILYRINTEKKNQYNEEDVSMQI